MKTLLVAVILTFGLSLGTSPAPMMQDVGKTWRVSVSSSGGQGNDVSWYPSISADGRFVAFTSYASNLVSGDTNGKKDVFVHDRQTGETTRVSVSSTGQQGNDHSSYPSISADGRFVAFHSSAFNLVQGDNNSLADVFVHDRQTGETTRVSVSSFGWQANGGSSMYPSISADGRFVAFHSSATNLVFGDTNGTWDIFVHDRHTSETTRVSVSSTGEQGNNVSWFPSISADGRFVAFQSYASNLVPGVGGLHIYVHDRQTGETTLASVSSTGEKANGESRMPSINADGRFVAFWSVASNLVTGDTNGTWDIFVHDRQTGETTRVSVSSTGEQANGGSERSSISADGRFVAFHSSATNLVQGDTNETYDIFVHDRQTGQTTRSSVSSFGEQGNGESRMPSINADGRFVAFWSVASNLVTGDTNSSSDVFVRTSGYTTNPPPLPDNTQKPKISIIGTPEIKRSAQTGNFTIYVSTNHVLYTSTGTAKVTLNGLTNAQGQPISKTQTAYANTPTINWTFDLPEMNVPRFTKPMNVMVSASITDEQNRTATAFKSMPEIKLPVVIVTGIKVSPWWESSEADEAFLTAMEAYGYRRAGNYPTLYPFSYWADLDPLSTNANHLHLYLSSYGGPLGVNTYADKVDIVAHSKGGLVARMCLKSYPVDNNLIRRLIMACSPHTGAVGAHALADTEVYRELLPTHDWYRVFPYQSFWQPHNNQVLKNLNATPLTVDYYLLYGIQQSWGTAASFTSSLLWYQFGPGDAGNGPYGVLSWSATGYEVVNPVTGAPGKGSLIDAFNPAKGAKEPKEIIALPYQHSGFLNNAVDTIVGILRKQQFGG